MEVLDVTAGGIAALLVPVIAMADEHVERAREAEALNGRLTAALARCVENYPVTSWGPTNDALDAAKALLDEVVGDAGTMDTTTPEETH